MKKIVLLSLIAALLLSLPGCNKDVVKKDTLLESATQISLIRTDLAQIVGGYVIVAANVEKVGPDSITVRRDSTMATVYFADSSLQNFSVGDPVAFVAILTKTEPEPVFENAYPLEGEYVFANTSTKSNITNFSYSGHTYDEQGRLTHYKTSGDINSETSNSYDENGNLAKQTIVTPFGTDIVTNTYDEQGRLKTSTTESETSVSDGMTLSYEYATDEQGRIASMSCKNSYSGAVTAYTYTYDEQGRKQTVHCENNVSVFDYEYVYDKFGNIICEKSTDSGGNYFENHHTYECAYILMIKEK